MINISISFRNSEEIVGAEMRAPCRVHLEVVDDAQAGPVLRKRAQLPPASGKHPDPLPAECGHGGFKREPATPPGMERVRDLDGVGAWSWIENRCIR